MGSKQYLVFSIPQRPISGLDGGIVCLDAIPYGQRI